MLFNSINFMFFFPIVVLIYFCMPHRFRWIWLLICSYYFYMSWNPKYALLMLASTVITYVSGRLISWSNGKENLVRVQFERKLWVTLCLVSNFAILFFFKYFGFSIRNINRLLSVFRVTVSDVNFDVLLPVGISFYTFQAVSYTIDVYRGEIEAEKNIGVYALFVAFFPQLVAGPIERTKNLLVQMREEHHFDYACAKNGLLLMLWGFFQKMVIADRAAILVDRVYNAPEQFTGISILFATILFAVQIYCDFSGYSDIAIGAAQVMGFRLVENFKQPYFAVSIQDFWRRWHISLSNWFKDYLYIPLGGNKCAKLKQYRNLMITFLASGLWHGASWNYIVWGGVHGIYQVIGNITRPYKERLYEQFHIRTEAFSFWLGRVFMTFFLVDFAWLFFRAPSISAAVRLLERVFTYTGFDTAFALNTYLLGADFEDFSILLSAIMVLFAVNAVQFWLKINIRDKIAEQNCLFRWLLYYVAVFVLLRYGIYGADYAQTQFIYFQF